MNRDPATALALDVRGIGFTYGPSFHIAEVSFHLNRGQILCVLGPNGSGKTTLFGVISGSLLPMRGEIYFEGLNLHRHLHQCASQMLNMPFHPQIVSMRTPFIYWQAYGLRYGLGFRETSRRILKLAPQMSMAKHMHKPFQTLSLGMQQKAALVAAFIPDVKMRILDEPFSGGIDPLAMETLTHWMQEARHAGETIIFSSQTTEHAERLGDQVLLMRDGRAVAFGTPSEIISEAGISETDDRPFAQAYIAITEERAGVE